MMRLMTTMTNYSRMLLFSLSHCTGKITKAVVLTVTTLIHNKIYIAKTDYTGVGTRTSRTIQSVHYTCMFGDVHYYHYITQASGIHDHCVLKLCDDNVQWIKSVINQFYFDQKATTNHNHNPE